MVTTQQFDAGKVEMSKVTRYKRGVTKTKIVYTSSVDKKKRLIIFPYVTVVLARDRIELGFPVGTKFVVFSKTTQWGNMVALLKEQYGKDVTELTKDEIDEMEDLMARRDLDFAKAIEEL